MIAIKYARTGDEHALLISGHAGAAARGRDIYCAAVSAIFQTALLGLIAIAKKHPEYVSFEGPTDTAEPSSIG